VSITISAVLAQRVVRWLPSLEGLKPLLGGKILVVSRAGGHSDAVVVRDGTEPRPERAAVRSLEKRIFRHGFDGHVRTEVGDVAETVAKAQLTGEPSLLVVDDPAFTAAPGATPILVIGGEAAAPSVVRVIPAAGVPDGVADEIRRRLARGTGRLRNLGRGVSVP